MKRVCSVILILLAIGMGSGNAAPTPTPGNPDFALVTSKLDEGGTFYLYADVEGSLLELINKFAPFFAAAPNPEVKKVPAIARSVVKNLGLESVEDVGMSVTPLTDGMERQKTFLRLANRSGIFQFFGGPPSRLEALSYVPADAVYVLVQDFDARQVIPVIERIVHGVGGEQALTEFRKDLADMKKEQHLDLEPMLKSLGGQFSVYARLDDAKKISVPLDKNRSLQIPTPSFLAMVKVENRHWYETIVDQMKAEKTALEKVQGPEGFETVAIKVPDNPVGFKPVLAQGRGWLVFASSLVELKNAVATAKSGKDIRTSQEFKKLNKGLPEKTNGVVFLSHRLNRAAVDLLKQLVDQAPKEEQAGLKTFADLAGGSKSGAGQMSVRINDSEGLYFITQGSISSGSIFQPMNVAPGAILAAIAVPNFLEAQVRSKVSHARADMRSIATGVEAYYIDWKCYPESTVNSDKSALSPMPAGHPVSSFRIAGPGGGALGLTTPVAYLKSYFPDPFADNNGTYGYYSVKKNGAQGYILWSPGPDGKYDLDWKVYDPSVKQPSPALLRMSYDPTNGTVSSGDIWRVRY